MKNGDQRIGYVYFVLIFKGVKFTVFNSRAFVRVLTGKNSELKPKKDLYVHMCKHVIVTETRMVDEEIKYKLKKKWSPVQV